MATIQPDSIVGEGFKGLPQAEPDGRARGFGAVLDWLTFAWMLQEGRKVVWAPVFLLLGIWTYFNLPVEPNFEVVLAVGGLAAVLVIAGRQFTSLIFIGLLLGGFALAKVRQEVVATPLLAAPVAQSELSGFVADADNRAGNRRILVVELDSATNIPQGEMPVRVRISTFDGQGVLIGDHVSLSARLTPLPMPVMPGGFDFGRDLYFQSIGAMGRSTAPVIVDVRPVPLKFMVRRVFHQLRTAMGGRITAAIPGAIGAFANSIITGERAAIPQDMYTSLQISGLAHIISISGLHMSLVAGGVFWVLRAFLALFPCLALHYPIKKWAAAAALVVGLSYMLLADSGSATERSYIMIAVMFFAILVDRPAVSMRNLAISTLIILPITPEEAMGASFQMSFLAVLGLVAFFEYWNNRPLEMKVYQASRWWRFTTHGFKLLGASILTTLVAGGLSSIAAVYHFGRISPYGTIANALALPISDLIVMPAAMLGVLLMPLGLEALPFKIVEWGLEATMWISDTVASWPKANLMMAHPALFGTSLMVAGAFAMCLVVGRLRWLGGAMLGMGLLVGQGQTRPAILIEDRVSNVAILDGGGHYVLADQAKGAFAAEKWLQINGEVETMADAAARSGWTCAEGACFSDLVPSSVAFVHESRGEVQVCPPVDIIIADYPLHQACPDAKLSIDRIDVWKFGAHAIYFDLGVPRVETAKAAQGERPWVYTAHARAKL